MSDRSAGDDLQDLLLKLLWRKVMLSNKAEAGLVVARRLWHPPAASLVAFGLSGVWKAAI